MGKKFLFTLTLATLALSVTPEPQNENPRIGTNIIADLTAPIIAESGKIGNRELYLLTPDKKKAINLTNNTFDDYSADLSPDGKYVAFCSNMSGQYKIYTLDLEGRVLTGITPDITACYPKWSPDGKEISFHNLMGEKPGIYSMNSDGNSARFLAEAYSLGGLEWSPNGDKIAFSRKDKNNHDLFVINKDGTGLKKLTTNPGYDGHFSWSPDGDSIIYVSELLSDSKMYRGIYTIGLSDNEIPAQQDLPYTWLHYDTPKFSQSGKNIAYADSDNFYVKISADNASEVIVLAKSKNIAGYAWQGESLIFSQQKDGKYQLYQAYFYFGEQPEVIQLTLGPGLEYPVAR